MGPAFTGPSVRALTPIFFQKAEELRDRWDTIVCQGYDVADTLPATEHPSEPLDFSSSTIVNISHWISRATFDVIGLAGFDYHFHALHDESDEVYLAYYKMFRSIDKGPGLRGCLQLVFPLLELICVSFHLFFLKLRENVDVLFHKPDECARISKKSLRTIHEAGKTLVEDKKRSILAEKSNLHEVQEKDLLTLLSKFSWFVLPSLMTVIYYYYSQIKL
jgi:hypothetical protein